MENASKALIIAGAILLSILIISLGIMIFNQAKGAMDTSSIDELELQQFNSKFTQYAGDNVRGSTVNTMLNAVVANNMAQDDATRKVEVAFSAGCKDSSGTSLAALGEDGTSAPKVSTGATYKVECKISDKGSDKGLVYAITVARIANDGNAESVTVPNDKD